MTDRDQKLRAAASDLHRCALNACDYLVLHDDGSTSFARREALLAAARRIYVLLDAPEPARPEPDVEAQVTAAVSAYERYVLDTDDDDWSDTECLGGVVRAVLDAQGQAVRGREAANEPGTRPRHCSDTPASGSTPLSGPERPALVTAEEHGRIVTYEWSPGEWRIGMLVTTSTAVINTSSATETPTTFVTSTPSRHGRIIMFVGTWESCTFSTYYVLECLPVSATEAEPLAEFLYNAGRGHETVAWSGLPDMARVSHRNAFRHKLDHMMQEEP